MPFRPMLFGFSSSPSLYSLGERQAVIAKMTWSLNSVNLGVFIYLKMKKMAPFWAEKWALICARAQWSSNSFWAPFNWASLTKAMLNKNNSLSFIRIQWTNFWWPPVPCRFKNFVLEINLGNFLTHFWPLSDTLPNLKS